MWHEQRSDRWHADMAAPEASMCHLVFGVLDHSMDQSDHATWKSVQLAWHADMTGDRVAQ
jgi:hypothetical protein